MTTLIETKTVATVASDLPDDELIELSDQVGDAIDMGIAAVLNSVRVKFPTVQFTVA